MLDLRFSRLESLLVDSSGSQYGFGVSKNDKVFEFYATERHLIDNWISKLKTVCILADFHEDYEAIKMIGEGAFATV